MSLTKSFGQFQQDAWVANHVYPGLREGFFLDIGAAHDPSGEGSNTWALEKQLGWRGILVDANPTAAEQLVADRGVGVASCALAEHDDEEVDFVLAGPLSGMTSTLPADLWEDVRHIGKSLRVKTKRPQTLLAEHEAPAFIHFMSLDVEGAELLVLQAFPFEKYRLGCACVEHNFDATRRTAIRRLFEAHEYLFVGAFGVDDFYVAAELARGRNLDPAVLLLPLERGLALQSYAMAKIGGMPDKNERRVAWATAFSREDVYWALFGLPVPEQMSRDCTVRYRAHIEDLVATAAIERSR